MGRLRVGWPARTIDARSLYSAVVITAGFILSPLSWWNDAVVNIPIALALAHTTSGVLGLETPKLFIAFYWITNIIGILLMILGARSLKRLERARLAKGLLYSLIASLIITVLVYVYTRPG